MKDYNERNYYENRKHLEHFYNWQIKLGFDKANFKEIPIEHIKKYGFFGGLWHTILRVLLAPDHFFAKMEPNEKKLPKILFVLLLVSFPILIGYYTTGSSTVLKQWESLEELGASITLETFMAMCYSIAFVIFVILFTVYTLFAAYFLKYIGKLFLSPLNIKTNDCLAICAYPYALAPLQAFLIPEYFLTIYLYIAISFLYVGVAIKYKYNLTHIETAKLLCLSSIPDIVLLYFLLNYT